MPQAIPRKRNQGSCVTLVKSNGGMEYHGSMPKKLRDTMAAITEEKTSGANKFMDTLPRTIIAANKGTDIEKAIGSDFKGKLSIAMYAIGMLLAGLSRVIPFSPILSYVVYACVAVMWFIPDRRLVRR